ncbi:hypothetical protein CXQ82_05120 [Pseudomonas sp. S09G 359]|nr:hypothetical protein CXQ82_05120 [Pseudomonas sp. S09G 359]
MWERACSRRGRTSCCMCWLTHCFREQARSHRDSGVFGVGVITGMSSLTDREPWLYRSASSGTGHGRW